MAFIQNPILRGFNPDPNILRVGDDYYIVTSTFEWFPGYQIRHSRDLRHWKLVSRPLNRISQLDMAGVPDSCGVWAPCLTSNDGIFYLLYINVRSFDGHWAMKDTPNYLVTTDDILGEWSDPIYLNASGFDSSFFHDDDGRTWLVNMMMDHRKNKFFGGIVLQVYDKVQRKLVGEIPAASSLWLSRRDCANLIDLALTATEKPVSVSDNQYRWVDIDHSRDVLGFEPQDSHEEKQP